MTGLPRPFPPIPSSFASYSSHCLRLTFSRLWQATSITKTPVRSRVLNPPIPFPSPTRPTYPVLCPGCLLGSPVFPNDTLETQSGCSILRPHVTHKRFEHPSTLSLDHSRWCSHLREPRCSSYPPRLQLELLRYSFSHCSLSLRSPFIPHLIQFTP